MEQVKLYDQKAKCCGCGACLNCCPKDAITMQEDAFGVLYPVIDEKRCVACGLCVKTCHAQVGKREPQKVYAASAKAPKVLQSSSSGGLFTELAKPILAQGGVVIGAALSVEDGEAKVAHRLAENLEALNPIKGSKYAQSDIGEQYREVKKRLNSGQKVLFTGTPCQVDGLKRYLNRDDENLITVDFICHGTPGQKLFREYLKRLEQKYRGTVTGYSFRDKKRGQELVARVSYLRKGKLKQKRLDAKRQSYYHYFLSGLLYRDSCYHCPFAGKARCSDITLGDYWGVYHFHQEEIKRMGMSEESGISCVLLNTEKGMAQFALIQDNIHCFASDFDQVAQYNVQLRHPCREKEERHILLDEYRLNGYAGIERIFQKKIRYKKYRYMMQYWLPLSVKRKIKAILRK